MSDTRGPNAVGLAARGAGDGRTAGRYGMAAFVAYLATVALSPLWYASVTPSAIVANAAALSLIGAFSAATPLAAPRGRVVPLAATLLVAASLAWGTIQLWPGAPAALRNPLWGLADAALGGVVVLRGAIAPDLAAGWLALAYGFAALLAFVLSLRFASDPARAKIILQTLAAAAGLYSLYGLADHLLHIDHVLFVPKNPFTLSAAGGYVSATYINANHFAALGGMGAIVAASLATEAIGPGFAEARTARRKLQVVIDSIRGASLPAAVFVVCSLAVVMSGSRAGALLMTVGLAVVALAAAVRRRSLVVIAAAGGLALIGAATALALGGQLIMQRFAERGFDDEARFAIYRLVADAIAANPWTGYGVGSFQSIFPLYRDGSVGLFAIWNAAHNSWLELAFDLGVPAAAAVVAALALVVGRCAVGALKRRRRAAAPIAAVACAVQVGLHSMVDFPLQSPANAFVLAAILGAGLGQAYRSERSGRARGAVTTLSQDGGQKAP